MKLLKPTIKWSVTAFCVAYLTYASADSITNTLNTIKYSLITSEEGFVKKDQALDMTLKYQRNGKNKLETYLKAYSQNLPVYERPNGIMVGDASYNFVNFTAEEKQAVCSGQVELTNRKQLEKAGRIKKILYDIYSSMEDKKDD